MSAPRTMPRVLRLAAGLAAGLAAALIAGGCAKDWTAPQSGPLERPSKVFVSAFDPAPGSQMSDPVLGAQLKRRMSGLTDQAVAIETGQRVSAVFFSQLVAALRSAGLPAEPGSADNMRANTNAVIVEGAIRSLNEDDLRQRRQSGFGAGRVRIVAEGKLLYRADIEQKPLTSFTAEDQSAPRAPARAAAPAAGAPEQLSPEVDAHVRRVAQAAADRIVEYARQQNWIKAPPAAPAVPATPPRRR